MHPEAGTSLRRAVGYPTVALLGVAAVAGMGLLVDYASRPGERGGTIAHWPAAAAVSPATDRPTLVVFVHPRCPCTRATVTELGRIVDDADRPLRAIVLAVVPSGEADDFADTDLVRAASRVAEVGLDRGGVEASRFGARTSGHAMLYDTRGALVFSGGITLARGHAGDSPGRAAILGAIRGGSAGPAAAEVYGCPLLGGEPCGDEHDARSSE